MLKYRLIFGTLMVVVFAGLFLADGKLDGSLTASTEDDSEVKGTIFSILVVLLIVMAQLEFSQLAKGRGLKVFLPVTIIGSILLGETWYLLQFAEIRPDAYVLGVAAFVLVGVFVMQHRCFGLAAVMANCGVSWLSVAYCGVLSAFAVAIRVEMGMWPLLMYICVVKCSDIGAYAFGRLFGKHKFSPQISPGKTWEGMAGGAILAAIVAIVFASSCGIITMKVWTAGLFGVSFAFIGQFGDLAESMLKRDAEQKDSANRVPGFGGVLCRPPGTG